jgi:seipin
MAYLKEQLLMTCYWLGDLLTRVLLTVSIAAAALSAAVFLYGTFYYAVIPKTALSIPVAFRFSSCAVVGQPCSFITAEVKLKKGQRMSPGNMYNIQLSLELPDSVENREVGMFLTCFNLSGSAGSSSPYCGNNVADDSHSSPYGTNMVAGEAVSPSSTCVSSMVPYRSSHLKMLDTVVYSPLYLTGLASQHIDLEVMLATEHQENVHSPTEKIDLEIQTSKLQIYSGTLKIWTNITGIKYWLYHHPMLSSVLGVMSLLAVICLMVAISMASFLSPQVTVTASPSPQEQARQGGNSDLAARSARARESLDQRLQQQQQGVRVMAETLDSHQRVAESIVEGGESEGVRKRSGW